MGHLEPQICVDPKTCVLWTSPALRGPICRFRRHCGLLPGTSCGSQGHLLELKSTRAVARNFGTCLDVERPFYTLWHHGQKLLPVFSRAVFFWKQEEPGNPKANQPHSPWHVDPVVFRLKGPKANQDLSSSQLGNQPQNR